MSTPVYIALRNTHFRFFTYLLLVTVSTPECPDVTLLIICIHLLRALRA